MDAGRAHLCQYLVQPLQRPVEVQLYPAGGAGDCLTPGGPTDEGRGRGDFSVMMVKNSGFSCEHACEKITSPLFVMVK